MAVKRTTLIISTVLSNENVVNKHFISELGEETANQVHLNRIAQISSKMLPDQECEVFAWSDKVVGAIASLVCSGPTRPGSFAPQKKISVFCLNDIPTHIVVNR